MTTRKPIRENLPVDEIRDNVKNNAIVTRSQTQERLSAEQKNDLNSLSSEEEEIPNDSDRTRRRRKRNSNSEENDNPARSRYYQTRNSSSSTERFDSSPSPTRQPTNYQFETLNNHVTPQLKTRSKRDPSYSPKIKENSIPFDHDDSSSGFQPCFVAFGVIVFFLIGLYFVRDLAEKDERINVLECKGRDDVDCIMADVKRTLQSMKAKYTHQDKNLWSDVFSGISNIIRRPQKPSIIVLLGDKTDPIDCLAVLLGNVSSNALHSGVLQLTPEKFDNDMGSVITSLRSSIKDKKAVIVWDLLKINEEALKAFHNLCDRINPLVEEVIYIITIIADDYDKMSNPLEFVEKKLYQKLSGKIKEDAIQPLITRITDGPILAVQPEPSLTDCPLPKVSKKY